MAPSLCIPRDILLDIRFTTLTASQQVALIRFLDLWNETLLDGEKRYADGDLLRLSALQIRKALRVRERAWSAIIGALTEMRCIEERQDGFLRTRFLAQGAPQPVPPALQEAEEEEEAPLSAPVAQDDQADVLFQMEGYGIARGRAKRLVQQYGLPRCGDVVRAIPGWEPKNPAAMIEYALKVGPGECPATVAPTPPVVPVRKAPEPEPGAVPPPPEIFEGLRAILGKGIGPQRLARPSAIIPGEPVAERPESERARIDELRRQAEALSSHREPG